MTFRAVPLSLAADTGPQPGHKRSRLRRDALWVTCFGVVIAGHLAFFLELSHRPGPPEATPSPAAVMIDLLPLPAAPTALAPSPKVPDPVEPGPAPETPSPPQTTTKLLTQPSAAIPPVAPPPVPADMPAVGSNASLPLPSPSPPAAPRLPRHVLRPPHRAAERAHPSKPLAALVSSTSSANDTERRASAPQSAPIVATRQDWESTLLAHIARFKNYPADAQDNGWKGTSILRFTLTRSGMVTTVVLVKSSGHADLDAAAIATVRRASPLPPPPETVPGEPITLTLPLQFSLDLD